MAKSLESGSIGERDLGLSGLQTPTKSRQSLIPHPLPYQYYIGASKRACRREKKLRFPYQKREKAAALVHAEDRLLRSTRIALLMDSAADDII